MPWRKSCQQCSKKYCRWIGHSKYCSSCTDKLVTCDLCRNCFFPDAPLMDAPYHLCYDCEGATEICRICHFHFQSGNSFSSEVCRSCCKNGFSRGKCRSCYREMVLTTQQHCLGCQDFYRAYLRPEDVPQAPYYHKTHLVQTHYRKKEYFNVHTGISFVEEHFGYNPYEPEPQETHFTRELSIYLYTALPKKIDLIRDIDSENQELRDPKQLFNRFIPPAREQCCDPEFELLGEIVIPWAKELQPKKVSQTI